jgi:histidyl-tRNA synthetase
LTTSATTVALTSIASSRDLARSIGDHVSAPRLVRGFDYYNRTTFEFVADALESAQNSIGGGGRYDQLAEELGGKPTSGIGFGSGVERLCSRARPRASRVNC